LRVRGLAGWIMGKTLVVHSPFVPQWRVMSRNSKVA